MMYYRLGGMGDHGMQHTLGSLSGIAQLGSLAALQGIASLAHANLAHGAALAAASQGLSAAQLQQLSAQVGLPCCCSGLSWGQPTMNPLLLHMSYTAACNTALVIWIAE